MTLFARATTLAAGVAVLWPRLVLVAQDKPIVVDVIERPKPAQDISISVVLGMFAIAGLFLLAAALGSAVVAASILIYKRWRDRSAPDAGSEPTHTRLRI